MINSQEVFVSLLNNCLKLYVNGVLEQYGLNENDSLDIVANFTGLPKEKLY